MDLNIEEAGDFLEFRVSVVPRASKTEIVGELGGAVKVRVASPPVDGAANKELIRFLAKRLRLPQGSLQLISGAASRHKTVRVAGLTAAQLLDALGR